MALDWHTRVNYQPAMLGVRVNKGNASNAAIRQTGGFGVNVPGVEIVAVTDCCGLFPGNTVDKSGLYEVFHRELRAAPLIQERPLNIECRLVQLDDLPTNTLFIGEILNLHAGERFLENGKPGVRKIRPLLLTMPDNRFWSVGEQVGQARKARARCRPPAGG